MSDQPSEEKSLPASHKKLEDARRKGRVAGSQDFVTALSVAATIAFLWARWPATIGAWQRVAGLSGTLARQPLAAAAPALGRALTGFAAGIVLPLAGLALAAAVLGNMIVKRGLPVSADPVKPRFERIHPMNGLKQIFSLKSLFEFLKALAKAGLLLAALSLTILLGLGTLLESPACGMGCLDGAASSMLKPLLAAGAALFLIAGLADIGLQRWLFLRQMRMTRTEMKRERKDLEGEPLFRRARRQRHQETLAGGRLDIAQATLVLLAPGELAAGLRFVAGETPAPLLVARPAAADLADALARATAAGVTIVTDPALARRVAARTGLGGFIPQSLFTDVAAVLVRNGLT